MSIQSKDPQVALKSLEEALHLYGEVTRMTADEVLEKKGNDLRIQLYRGFRRQRWRGGKTIAQREANRRAKQGKGTKISEGTRNNPGTPPSGLKGYAALVWRELQRRQRGIGVLAASFLLRRWRPRKSGRYLAKNNTNAAGILSGRVVTDSSRELGLMSKIEQRPGSFRLTAYTPGIDIVDDRYGIATQAMDTVTADMLPYIRRKMDQQKVAVFR